MARKPRIDFAGARHHVMNRGADHATIFPDDEACSVFLGLVAELPERFPLRVHGYALMPNHYHLMVESLRPRLSDAMKDLQGRYALWFNRARDSDGSIYRGRFHNRVVDHDAYWMHLLAHLHLNPVRANLVAKVDDAIWTSHEDYAGKRRAPQWLTTDELLGYFGSKKEYVSYVQRVRSGAESGPDEFDPDHLFSSGVTATVPELKELPLIMTPEEALARVTAVTGVVAEDLRRGQRGRGGNPARWVAMWWLLQVTDLRRNEVARLLGAAPANLTRALAELPRRRQENPTLDAWLTKLEPQQS